MLESLVLKLVFMFGSDYFVLRFYGAELSAPRIKSYFYIANQSTISFQNEKS